jgi:hypothetical protein
VIFDVMHSMADNVPKAIKIVIVGAGMLSRFPSQVPIAWIHVGVICRTFAENGYVGDDRRLCTF